MESASGGPFYTPRWSPADSLLTTEVMFLQALYIRASGNANNIALTTGSGGSVAVADITSQFDGVTTTFTIPSYTGILLFIITGWPPNGALDPSADFTTPSATTVALNTSQVTAPVAGTTGIILYTPT